jgi:hypothetical protein
MKFTEMRCSGCHSWLARWVLAKNETCDALVGAVKAEKTEEGSIYYLEIVDGKDSGSERRVPFANLVLGMGFLEQRVIGRDPAEPLESADPRRLPTASPITGRRPRFIGPARIFILFAVTSKRISRTCPRPIRRGSMSSSDMNRPSAAPKEKGTPKKFSSRYCSG